jgi:hypothetical protein
LGKATGVYTPYSTDALITLVLLAPFFVRTRIKPFAACTPYKTAALTFRTLFSFDYVNQFEEFQDNQYAVYEPSWIKGEGEKEQLTVTKVGLDRFSGAQGITNTALNRRLAVSGMFDYERSLGQASFVSASLFGYMDRYGETDLFQPEKHAHIGARVFYAYAGKYLLQLSNAVVASPKFSR